MTSATTLNGYVYVRRTAKRLVPEALSSDEIRPLTRDQIDFHVVRGFLDTVSKLKIYTCTNQQVEQLFPLAYSFLNIIGSFTNEQFKRNSCLQDQRGE